MTRFTEGRLTAHEWSPDGRKLAVRLQGPESSNLWVVEANGDHPVPVTQFTTETVFSFTWLPDSRYVVITAGTRSADAVLIREFR